MALIFMLSSAIHCDLIVALAVPEQYIAILAHQMVKNEISGCTLPSRKAFVTRGALIWALFGI